MGALSLRWLPVAVVLAGVTAAWLLALGKPAPETVSNVTAPPRVEVLELASGGQRVVVRTHGSVAPRTEIELLAEAAGRVRRVAAGFATGAFFAQDEVLLELDPTDATLLLERAEASLQRAGAGLRIAKARLARQRSLAQGRVASASQLEETEYSLAVAHATLRDARAARGQARRELERMVVRAPFAGRVRSKRVGIGQYVARGARLGAIYAVDYAEIRLPISPADLAFLDLAEGAAPGRVRLVRLSAPFAGDVREWSGWVARTEGALDEDTRMLHVVVRIADPQARQPQTRHAPLPMGLFVEAEIEGRYFPDVFALPRSALRGDSEVAVVDGAGRIALRRVEVIRVEDERVLVSGGLEAGERVVASAALARVGGRIDPVLGRADAVRLTRSGVGDAGP
jgi:RND family efflux transporter MFP subunit